MSNKLKPKKQIGMKKHFLCLLLLSGAGFAYAAEGVSTDVAEVTQQGVTVKGVVTDAKGEPIIGATVTEKGTKNATVTDYDGNYTLTVANRNATLVVSYIGYIAQEAKAGSDITLKEDLKLLNEVVVIGYDTQRKGDVTSAIASVKSEDFLDGRIGDAGDLIKGKVAGLSIVQSSGDPNAKSSIMLRGITTVMGNVQPLVLVDGIEGSLTTVAPENIASIDVLKDASAAAIYGTRGANGVILITTKTGRREQKAEVSYAGYVTFSKWAKKAEFMDTNDVIYGRTNFNYDGYDTDWLEGISRKAGFTHNHSLSIRGGGKHSTYSANVMFNDDRGILRNSGSKDLKIQLDVTQYALKDILKFNVNALYSRHKNPSNANGEAYLQALNHNPSSPVYNEDGSYYEEFSRFQYYNPIEMQNELIGDTRSHFAQLTGNITVEPIKNWVTNLMLSIREDASEGESYYTDKYYSQVAGGVTGSAGKSSDNGRSDNLELTTKYNFNIGQHRISALAGYSYLYEVYDGFSAGNSNFPAQFYLYNSLQQGTYLTDKDHTASMSSYKNDSKLIGFFGRVTYAFGEKYNLMASIRHEGSSKFGANHKWGTFPAVSAGWTISNESFMEGTKSWLDNLKLRIGYGVTGVIPGDSYASLTLYDYDPYGKHRSTSGTWEPSMQVAQNPNPDLKWEKTGEFNVGLDWAMFNGRLSGNIDFYNKKTVDLLYPYSVPVPPNMYGETVANVGEMRNTGIEVAINAIPIQTKEFEWSTTLTMSHNSNKLLSLSNDLYETDNFHEEWPGLGRWDPISVPTHYIEVGHRLGDFWGLKSVGVSENGVVLVEVSDGNGGWVVKEFDTKYNEQVNRQNLGSGLPTVIAGWSNTFRYKGFDLNLQFTGQFGYKILNGQRAFYENNSIAYNRLKSAADWYPAVDTNLQPVLDENGNQKMVQLSSSMPQGIWSDHLENGDFVKLANATLGYTVPLGQKLGEYIQNLRMYISGQNLFCITGYSGLDPEVSNYFRSPGIDPRDKYPTIRSFTFGLNVTF